MTIVLVWMFILAVGATIRIALRDDPRRGRARHPRKLRPTGDACRAAAEDEGLPEIPIKVPLVPGLPHQRSAVRSMSTPGLSYVVDTRERTCTCADFIDRRASFAIDDVRRICKHQYSMMLGLLGALGGCDEVALVILSDCHFKQRYYSATLASGRYILIGSTPGEQWLDIITRKAVKGEKDGCFSGPYARFGLNPQRNRWAYGEAPPRPMEIKRLVRSAGLPEP